MFHCNSWPHRGTIAMVHRRAMFLAPFAPSSTASEVLWPVPLDLRGTSAAVPRFGPWKHQEPSGENWGRVLSASPSKCNGYHINCYCNYLMISPERYPKDCGTTEAREQKRTSGSPAWFSIVAMESGVEQLNSLGAASAFASRSVSTIFKYPNWLA